jgi:polyferredoxin
MSLVYRILADLIVAAHFAYVAFVIGGLVVVLIGGIVGWKPVRNCWFRLIHLLMIGIVVAEAWCGATCPLTIWENKLRRLSGETTYAGGFIANALHDALFFEAEPWVFTLCYTLFALAVLATLFLVPPHRPHSAGKSIVRSTKME